VITRTAIGTALGFVGAATIAYPFTACWGRV
jgi:hypothetical protein